MKHMIVAATKIEHKTDGKSVWWFSESRKEWIVDETMTVEVFENFISTGNGYVKPQATVLKEMAEQRADEGFVAYTGFEGLFGSVLNLALEHLEVARVNIHHSTIDFKDGSVISFHAADHVARGWYANKQDARY